MISYIKGELAYINEDSIIVECNNIGYEVRVPVSLLNQLPGIGGEIKVHTYMYVREDALCLYGFSSRDDLNVFKLLITVNGIGPKAALGILSSISPDDLRFAILAGDTKTISKAPGIGAKTASKLILELKDKFKLEDAFEQRIQNEESDGQMKFGDTNIAGIRNDAIQALVALGYSATDASKMVREVTIMDGMDVEEVLKQSLKKISFL